MLKLRSGVLPSTVLHHLVMVGDAAGWVNALTGGPAADPAVTLQRKNQVKSSTAPSGELLPHFLVYIGLDKHWTVLSITRSIAASGVLKAGCRSALYMGWAATVRAAPTIIGMRSEKQEMMACVFPSSHFCLRICPIIGGFRPPHLFLSLVGRSALTSSPLLVL